MFHFRLKCMRILIMMKTFCWYTVVEIPLLGRRNKSSREINPSVVKDVELKCT